jgi:hypothetical protein
MRGSISRGRILAFLVAVAIPTVLAGECLADDQPIKWRARPFLEITRSSTNCGIQLQEPFNLEFDGKVLRTSAWSWTTYDMTLLEPLNPDGSGQVYAITMPQHRSVVLKFEPGTGPRSITYWHRYNARCIWTFIPST